MLELVHKQIHLTNPWNSQERAWFELLNKFNLIVCSKWFAIDILFSVLCQINDFVYQIVLSVIFVRCTLVFASFEKINNIKIGTSK